MKINLDAANASLAITLIFLCGSSSAATISHVTAADLLAVAYPEQAVINADVADFDKQMAGMFDRSATLTAREKAAPGFRKRFLSAVDTVVEQDLQRDLPILRAQCIDVYDNTLTQQEMQDLMTFLRTPTGQKLSRLAILAAAESDAETSQEVMKDRTNMVAANLGPSDGPAVEALMRSSAYPKFKFIGQKISEISSHFFDQENSRIASDLESLAPQFQ